MQQRVKMAYVGTISFFVAMFVLMSSAAEVSRCVKKKDFANDRQLINPLTALQRVTELIANNYDPYETPSKSASHKDDGRSSMSIGFVTIVCCVIWVFMDMVMAQDFTNIDSPASCEQKYSYRGPREGIFQSPKFPENYPERTRCRYFFRANDNGRIRIRFDFFDLETSDDDCKYDYLEFSNINQHGVKEKPRMRYCGKSKPPEYISTQSKLEIIFFSDVTTNARGFFGHYEFLDINWHPFPLSTVGCGAGYLTGHGGVIQSPLHPEPYPKNSGCTWIISVLKTERILLYFESLDISHTINCHEMNSLMVFEGFITLDTMPVSYCGQLNQEPESKKEYLSKKNRLVIRFQTGDNNPGNHNGFKATWSAVTLANSGECGDKFECTTELSGVCDVTPEQELCNMNQHYCIDISLTCDNVANCGANDYSDENKCLYYIVKYVAYIGGSLVVVIVLIVTIVCCYKRKCCRRSDVKYRVPQDQQCLSQSATHSMMSTQSSGNLPVRSLDHSPRSSCLMYTTAFTDTSPTTEHVNCKQQPAQQTTDGAHTNHTNSVAFPNNTSTFVPEVFEDDFRSYRGHQKRPSYHMMKELCYEDGKIVTANI